jgi:FkbM family methyltransferase
MSSGTTPQTTLRGAPAATSGPPMRPEPYVRMSQPAASADGLARQLVSMLRERRLPYRIGRVLDRLCAVAGSKHKTVRAGGFRYKLRRLTTDEFFVANIVLNAEYTPSGYEIGSSDTVVDIGGNIGVFSVLAGRRASGGRVLAFEPVLENYTLLRANIELNALRNVTPVRAAVLDTRSDDVRIFLNASNTGAHSVFPGYGTRPTSWFETVSSITLEDVFRQWNIDRIDFLKLDCEGSEYQILYGLPDEYFPRIGKIVMEYHTTTDAARVDDESSALVAFLVRQGYRIDCYRSFGGGGFIRAKREPQATSCSDI